MTCHKPAFEKCPNNKPDVSTCPDDCPWFTPMFYEQDVPLSKRKLLDALKQARVKTEGMNDNLFLYSVGRNGLIDWLLVATMCGDFDEGRGE